jgi:hypothetical protein
MYDVRVTHAREGGLCYLPKLLQKVIDDHNKETSR